MELSGLWSQVLVGRGARRQKDQKSSSGSRIAPSHMPNTAWIRADKPWA